MPIEDRPNQTATTAHRSWPAHGLAHPPPRAQGLAHALSLLLATLLCSTLLLLAPRPALAWGAEGHRAVADLAASRLTPAARAEVARLLTLEGAADLAAISTWADETRSPSTQRWHFVNFEPGNCHYDAAAHCPGGQCVVGAIERQALKLADHAAPDTERLKALKYLVHLVADVHQPLHAGFAHDRGGNTFQLAGPGRSRNLHAYWDSGLIDLVAPRPGELLGLVTRREAPPPAPGAPATPAQWGEASCAIVQTPGFYPSSHKLGLADMRRHLPLLLDQIDMAGWRLAGLLNEVLGGDRP